MATSRSSCSATWLCWVCRSLSCSPSAARPGQRLAGQVFVALRERGLGLVLELVGLLLELPRLQLDALSRRRHVGHAAADLLEALELLLIGQIECLAGVLSPVKDLVRLRLQDGRHSLEYSCQRSALLVAPSRPL